MAFGFSLPYNSHSYIHLVQKRGTFIQNAIEQEILTQNNPGQW